ncbi:hypothetical protein GCM10010116_59790 [Microbispora rosea subsp. aerata]|nr:hypothetical protein GCM10010116_59790 [Microbispora rosea subsp. aerata]GIH58991.1 hypothetical protein Mro02_59050 [Microbispora rosea subsp. aerata]GLJ82127.1 hypothetical protein GCM10017588_08520 [Microbispora rosea subsp. aerata]
MSAQAAAFDPFGKDYLENPPESLRWSRDGEPVFYSPKLGYWVVTRYEDVKAVFRDNIRFSPSIALEKITPTCDEANEILARYDYGMNRTLVNEDEPAHMPRRRALMDPFTPKELARHEPMVRRLTREYVDRFIDSGKADLVDEMLWEIPLTVALHFLGVPEEDMDTLRRYSIAHTVNTWGRPTLEEQINVAENVGRFWQYAGKVLEKLRQDPSGHGWMPYSIRVQQEQPDVITDSYLHSMMMAGIVAAHETTANAAANAIKLLLEHRQAWDEICRDPSLISNAVEECLRHSGSVAAWRRLVTEDTTIGGVEIPKGAKLLIVNSSANHDERHFDAPDDFDIRRENASDHLTFGYGSHQCMGKNLARMELQIFLEELTKRLPHMRLVPGQEFTYLPNTSFRGPDHLWVEWDPARNPERTDPEILSTRQQVRIGEPSRRAITRTVTVTAIDRAAEGVVTLTLSDAYGRPLPKWSPGAHIDIEVGGLSRQYSLCGDPRGSAGRTDSATLACSAEHGSSSDHPDAATLACSAQHGSSSDHADAADHSGFPAPNGSADGAAGLSSAADQSGSGYPLTYQIAVRREAASRGGSRYIHEELRVGDRLTMRGPRNHFRLSPDADRYVFVAGGIGITPIIAMADHVRSTGKPYEIHYCGRDLASMAFLDRLERDHAEHLRVYPGAEGIRLDVAALLAEPVKGAQVYACGPGRLLTALEEAMRHWPEDSLRVEHFTATRQALDPDREHEFDVELRDSGRTIRVAADQTVLDALRAAGVDVRSDCEEGLCGSCQVSVLDGEVDHRDLVLTKAERAAGTAMMICCSRARGTKLTLAL